MEIVLIVLLGFVFGSFINALVWRLRHKRDMWHERSECTHCRHVLAWYDLVPFFSWLSLGGKCRYCHRRIEDHPLVEVITPIIFVVSYLVWPYGWNLTGYVAFGLWLIALVVLIALAVYDLRWYVLPDVMVFPLTVIGLVIGLIIRINFGSSDLYMAAIDMAGGVFVIAGLYWALYQLSQGRYVGYGDVKLSVFIGLLVGWQGALLSLMLANFLGLLFVLPGLLLGKLTPKSKIPFGPFLIAACIMAFLWGESIINWYTLSILGL